MENFDTELKTKLDKFIKKIKYSTSVNSNDLSLLIEIKKRLDYCGHCNGQTYDNGDCFEHFTE